MSEPVFRGKDKHGKSIWQLRPSQGVKVGEGYVRHCETFHGAKTDARKRLRELEQLAAAGVDLSGGRTPFDEYAAQWLEEKQRHIAPRTYAGYEREVRKLVGVLGNTPLSSITAPVVREVLKQVRESIKGGKGSENSLRATYRVFHAVMAQAAKDDLVLTNPVAKVDAPHEKPRERRSLDFAQYAELRERIDEATEAAYAAYDAKEQHLRETGHQNKERHALRGIHEAAYLQAVRIMHATGMRPSEVLALQWKHIDLAAGCIRVEQATRTADGGIKETKTKNGVRNVYLKERTAAALAEWRRFQYQAANKLGIELGTGAWVVCTDTFTQADQRALGKWWNQWRVGAGFDGWELYELRHTQATLLINSGANIKAVCAQMGHSSLAVTQIYTHANEDVQRSLADMLP